MQKARKQLLGLGGLALVAAITTVACTIPVDATSAGGNSEIIVQVNGASYETKIQSPLDGSSTISSTINVSNLISHAYGLTYTLTYVSSDGSSDVVFNLTDHAMTGITDLSTTDTFSLDLNSYGGYGTYRLTATVLGDDGGTKSDSVQFTYGAIAITGNTTSATNGDPIISFNYAANVGSLRFTVYNSKGEAVLSNIPYIVSNPGTAGTGSITLLFASNNIPSGSYYILADSYASNNLSGDPIQTGVRYDFDYTRPGSPDVPNTGALIGALNISQADFTITCLIGFLMVTVVTLVVMRKHSEKTR